MKSLITFLFLFTALAVYSQGTGSNRPEGYEAKENVKTLGSSSGSTVVKLFDERYEGVKGTPYMFPEWSEGEVFLREKKKVKFQQLNYNSFTNELVYRDPENGETMQINKYQVDFFTIVRKDTLLFVPVKLPRENDIVFARLFYEDKSSAYLYYAKEFLAANYEGGYSADRKADEYVDKPQIYIKLAGQEELLKLKGAKKNIIELFGDKKSEMATFINKGKADFKSPEYVSAMMGHYDSLL